MTYKCGPKSTRTTVTVDLLMSGTLIINTKRRVTEKKTLDFSLLHGQKYCEIFKDAELEALHYL